MLLYFIITVVLASEGLYFNLRFFLSVDQNKGMLGTFAPQREPYVHVLDEETTPSGVLARGIYSANLKVPMHKWTVACMHAPCN